MAFNCISLQLSSFVNIYVNICHYSFISGMLRASLDRLLGKNLCIKCIIQVPTKHPNERVLPITWKNQFIALYPRAPKMWNLQVPSPEFTGALGAASTCPAEGTPSSPPGSCVWRSGFGWWCFDGRYFFYNASSRSCKIVSDEQKLPKNEGSKS